MRPRTIALALMLALPAATASAAGVDEGGVSSDRVPWSGYWWPHHLGGLQGPAAKYDKATGKQAAAWEAKTHPAGVEKWFGFCHAWSAACVTEKEPRRPVSHNGVTFGVGDQKGLLCLAHAQDVANVYGQRNNGGGDPNDLAPDELWRLLKLYVQQQNIPLIVDTSADAQVWNYPVYSYRVTYSPLPGGAPGMVQAVMRLNLADDAVHPEYVGTQTRAFEYKFTCKMNGDKVVAGTGKWNNPNFHPDFAWYPYLTVPENPEVDLAAVRTIVGAPKDKDDVKKKDNPTPVNPDVPVTPPPAGGTPGFTPPPAERVLAITPQQLAALVVNRTSAFKFDVTVDKFDGQRYEEGTPFVIQGVTEKSGYLYVFEILPDEPAPPPGPDGKKEAPPVPLRLLFPLPGQDNRVYAGKPITFPRKEDKFTFVASAPYGEHRLKSIVTTRPLMLSGLDLSDKPPGQQQQQGPVQVQKPTPIRVTPQEQVQLQEVIQKHRQDKLKPGEAEQKLDAKPDDVLGPFAQDETLFIVIAKGDKPGQDKPGQDKPGQDKPKQDKPGQVKPVEKP